MSGDDGRLKELLDGKLSAQEIADDPVLASLAERIYGSEFLDNVGISRGETKRALVEQFSEIDGDDLLIVDLPEGGLPLPMPDDMPPNPSYELESDQNPARTLKQKFGVFIGSVGLVAALTNLFYGFGNFLTGCGSEIHSTCTSSLKLNWLDFFRMDEHIAWSPTGTIGIPDVLLMTVCLWYIVTGLRSRN
jgi:hypothetical protein